jgi:hypothetical protein
MTAKSDRGRRSERWPVALRAVIVGILVALVAGAVRSLARLGGTVAVAV